MKYGISGQTKIGLATAEELPSVDSLVLVILMLLLHQQVLETSSFGFQRKRTEENTSLPTAGIFANKVAVLLTK